MEQNELKGISRQDFPVKTFSKKELRAAKMWLKLKWHNYDSRGQIAHGLTVTRCSKDPYSWKERAEW